MVEKVKDGKYAKYLLFFLMVSFYSSSPLNAMLNEVEDEEKVIHLVPKKTGDLEEEVEKIKNENHTKYEADQIFIWNVGSRAEVEEENYNKYKADQIFIWNVNLQCCTLL